MRLPRPSTNCNLPLAALDLTTFSTAEGRKRHKINLERRNSNLTLENIKQTTVIADLVKEVHCFPNLDISPFTPDKEARLLETVNSRPLFTGLSHVDLAKSLDLFDLASGTKVSGRSFYYLKNYGVLLEQAIIRLAMDTAIAHGFTPVSVPELVKPNILLACGFHPRDDRHADVYRVSALNSKKDKESQKELFLVPTAEVPLAGLYANSVIRSTPLLLVAHSHCFRPETGGSGRQTKGLYRVHQFSKVELFALCTGKESENVFNLLLNVQKDVVNQLGLMARILEMPATELGAAAARKIDFEAYMPSRPQLWGEISSLSHCTDYQARRLNIKTMDGFAHTLNATCAAIPRLMVAILEQCQLPNGTVQVPKCLRDHLKTDIIQ